MSKAEVASTQPAANLVGDELKDAIKRQVEFYFSKANLTNDAFLVSQMNSQMYVPVEVIINFSKIQQLTNDTALLVEAIRDSSVCSLNETNDAIKPNIKSERNTIILREIPSATKPEDVKAIFEGCGEVTNVRSDVGDTWFVTMASEDQAVNTLLTLRSKTFNNAPIKARLKSENVLKSFYPTQPAENVISGGASAPYGGRGYYGTATGYYDVPNNYGVQYNTGAPRMHQFGNGMENNRYAMNQRGPGGRGAGPQSFRNNRAANGQHVAASQQQPKEGGRAKSNSFDQRSNGSKKSKDKRSKQSGAPQSNGSTKKAASASERQPILSAANFPPLPTVAPGSEAASSSNIINYKYSHEDIMEIVKNMDEQDCTLPAGKMDFDAHPAALTSVAHPDLLRNQRTYSIEQAREAMRQGRPIRSDSVGSIDYESMMYGEDYTKEAREQRRQKAENEGADAVSAPKDAQSSNTSKPKIVGYAAAVIHGTPAPVPAVEVAKKKTPKAKTPKSDKEEKKGGKKGAKNADHKNTVVDESLPKTGAWGGRNFLDVVKSEPPAQSPAAPVKTTPGPSSSEKKGEEKGERKEKHSKERSNASRTDVK